jgi:transcriptional regulator with XRE-family HTH domain
MSTHGLNIGDRLREERKRLGLSQTDFARLAGVHLNTQSRYEKGDREPDSSYLEALGKEGVDVNYVLFGIASDEIVDCPYVAGMKFPSSHVAKPITLTECRDMAAGVTLRATGNAEGLRKWFECCQTCPLNPGKVPGRNPGYLSDSDISLLAEVLEGVDGALLTQGKSMHHAKKAQAVALLYRAFKSSGKVDSAVIDEAVKLAAD